MRDLVAKSTNPESDPESSPSGSSPSPSPARNGARRSRRTRGKSTGRAVRSEPPRSTTSTEAVSDVAEPVPAIAACPLAAAYRADASGSAPDPAQLRLVDPPKQRHGRWFDEFGRRRAHIHTLYRAPSGCQYLQPRPLLRLSGKWLEEAGFPIGQPIAVRVEPGRLVIEAV